VQMPDHSTYLPEQWWRVSLQYSVDRDVAAKCLDEIVRAYTRKNRHYHNLHHVAALLRLSDQYAAQLQDKTVVDFAIFYHDIVYNVPGSDNEHKSALLAAKRLKELLAPPDIIKEVSLFIEATKHHDLFDVRHTGDLRYFLDFDMSILAAPWEEYEVYIKSIRKEYKWYPDMVYNPGRKQFLMSTLAKPNIFHTEAFRQTHEARARENMQKELGILSSRHEIPGR
jgi:predicted metal-dependent HD superfamily phosphohydrolase